VLSDELASKDLVRQIESTGQHTNRKPNDPGSLLRVWRGRRQMAFPGRFSVHVETFSPPEEGSAYLPANTRREV